MRRASTSTRSGTRDLSLIERLDDVPLAEILVVGQADTALEALMDLADVLLEPLERRDGALPDDDAISEETDLRTACDDAVPDVATGDGADPRHPEDLADLGL